MNRRDYERIRYNPNIQDYQRLQGSIKTKQRKQKVKYVSSNQENSLFFKMYSFLFAKLLVNPIITIPNI